MNDITAPLRLAVGSHEAGSGKGCAMNLISWENGDTTITDFPSCSDPVLARIVQSVNDTICEHRDGDLLCSPCSLEVLALGHRTVGTGGLPVSVRKTVWLAVAEDSVRYTESLVTEPNKWLYEAKCALVMARREIEWGSASIHVGTVLHYAGLALIQAFGPSAKLPQAQRALDLFEKLTVDYRVEVTREISASDVEHAYACMTA